MANTTRPAIRMVHEVLERTGRLSTLSALLLSVGCGAGEEPEPPSAGPPAAIRADPAAPLAYVRESRREAQLEQDHLFHGSVGAGTTRVAVLIASSPSRRYLTVFEADAGPRPAGSASAGADSTAYRPVLEVDFERHGTMWMVPDAPSPGDLDGDGRDEVLITFSTHLADRSSRTAIVLVGSPDSWRALGHPAAVGPIRARLEEFGMRASIFQDDKLSRMNAAGHETTLRGLHSGGDWRLVTRPDGSAGLLATAIVTHDGRMPGPYRVALAIFRLSDQGFVLDPDWNAGRVHLTAEPRDLRDTDFEQIVAGGFRHPR